MADAITEHVKADIRAKIQSSLPEPAPGKMQAFDWTKINAGLSKLDGVIQKLAPIVETFTAPEYAALIDVLAKGLHGVVTPTA